MAKSKPAPETEAEDAGEETEDLAPPPAPPMVDFPEVTVGDNPTPIAAGPQVDPSHIAGATLMPDGPFRPTPDGQTVALISMEDAQAAAQCDDQLKELENEFQRRVEQIHQMFWQETIAKYGLASGKQYGIDRTYEPLGHVYAREIVQPLVGPGGQG